MRLWCGLMFSAGLLAQDAAPLGVVEGSVVAISQSGSSGEIGIQGSDRRIYRFSFDQRTYVERDRHRVSIAAVRKGDRIEVLSDIGASPEIRYARIVHISDPNTPSRLVPPPRRSKPYVSPTESIIPRGDLTFSGVVRRVSGEMLVLRTRLDGDKQIILRPDTRYLESGAAVDVSVLKTNCRVFVRAGRNLDGDLEAYQVIWGGILEPDR
jgi:hypothetical protein